MTLNELHQRGWLKGDGSLEAAARLLAGESDSKEKGDAETHVIVRVLMAVGAWLAGLFLCGFLALAFENLLNHNMAGFTWVGIVTIAIGVAIQRCCRHMFLEQLGLAISVAGHLALSVGLYDVDNSFVVPLFGFLLLCPFVYWLSGHAVQRYLSVSMIWLMMLMASWDRNGDWWLFWGALVALLVVSTLFSGTFPQPWLRPAAIASVVWLFVLTFAAVAESGHNARYRFDLSPLMAPLGMAMGLGLAALLAHLCRFPRSRWWAFGVFTILLVALALVQAPGLVVALGLAAVAHARRDRVLEWLALIALIFFIAQFYHYLGVTLLTKSIVLMSVGAVLAVFGAVLVKRTADESS